MPNRAKFETMVNKFQEELEHISYILDMQPCMKELKLDSNIDTYIMELKGWGHSVDIGYTEWDIGHVEESLCILNAIFDHAQQAQSIEFTYAVYSSEMMRLKKEMMELIREDLHGGF